MSSENPDETQDGLSEKRRAWLARIHAELDALEKDGIEPSYLNACSGLKDRQLDRVIFLVRGDSLDQARVLLDKLDGNNNWKPPRGLRATPFSSVSPKPVPWLIPGWLARGGITLLAGQAGAGKTTLALRIAAMVSQGENWMDGKPIERSKVMIYTGEDSLVYGLRPVLEASGADLEWVMAANRSADNEPFHPAEHLGQLHIALAKDKDIGMVILDPVMAVAESARDEYRASEIRKALQPVQEMAEAQHVAVLGVTHFIKRHNSAGSGALDRVIGSQAWGAVARMVWAVDKIEGGGKALMIAKSNLSVAQGGYAYEVETREIPNSVPEKGSIETRAVVFGKRIAGTADDVFVAQEVRKDSPKTNDAADWMASYFDAHQEAVRWDDVLEAGESESHTKRTLRTARNVLKSKGKIETYKEFSSWYWRRVVDGE